MSEPKRLPVVTSAEQAVVGGCGGRARMSPAERQRDSRRRLPEWFRTSLPTGAAQVRYNRTNASVQNGHLNTVCQEARCPNIHDCWGRGTATFMVAGEVCTRGCRFCAVGTTRTPEPLSASEPERLAEAVAAMRLSHAVITCVNRDDLDDGGAAHHRACLEAVAARSPSVDLEFLCSDLDGDLQALAGLLADLPIRVFAHNVECVPRLDPKVRDPRASFARSLTILEEAKRLRPDLLTKSSLMVGVGETDDEVVEVMESLRGVGVDLLTIGQYLQPSERHLQVDRFPEPARFADWQRIARELGFLAVASGPLVRSSFRAGLLLKQAAAGRSRSSAPTAMAVADGIQDGDGGAV